MNEDNALENKKLSRKERKRLAKQEKKEQKRARKVEDRAFEKQAPKRKLKITAWIIELVGLAIVAVPAILIIGAYVLAFFALVIGVLVFFVFLIGLLIFGIGYFIYANSVEKPTLDGYFAVPTSFFDWATNLVNSINNINGVLLTVFGGLSLAIEIVGFVLLLLSFNSLSKKHKVSYIILMSLIMILSIVILIFGITKIA